MTNTQATTSLTASVTQKHIYNPLSKWECLKAALVAVSGDTELVPVTPGDDWEPDSFTEVDKLELVTMLKSIFTDGKERRLFELLADPTTIHATFFDSAMDLVAFDPGVTDGMQMWMDLFVPEDEYVIGEEDGVKLYRMTPMDTLISVGQIVWMTKRLYHIVDMHLTRDDLLAIYADNKIQDRIIDEANGSPTNTVDTDSVES